MRSLSALWHRRAICGLKILSTYLKSYIQHGLYYVVEEEDWVIRHVGEAILGQLRKFQSRIPCAIATTNRGLHNQVIHFGSIWCFVSKVQRTHRSNRLVVTFFHGHEEMGPEMQKALRIFQQNIPRLDAVVTSNCMMMSRLKAWGVPEKKLHLIPLGADLQLFRPPSSEQRMQNRQRLEIPDDAICIGSFQKDGVGWEDGLEPKLIKGPDIFIEVVRHLSGNYPIFVLLTGPARGYVKRGLEEAGISYCHDYVEDYHNMPSYYHCLDLYLITSREEGGPKALPECMATGVPIISTSVGMAPDMIEQGLNGFIVDVEDIEGLVKTASQVIENTDLRERVANKALHTVQSYSWQVLAQAYYDRIYAPLMS